jgi:hypothetical protein
MIIALYRNFVCPVPDFIGANRHSITFVHETGRLLGAQYRFEIADGVRLADPVELECGSEQDAMRTGHCVVVLDEAGAEIYEAAVTK